MTVLDASVLIGLLSAKDSQHDRALRFFDRHLDEQFALHAVTHAEVLVGPTRNGTVALVEDRLQSLEMRTVALQQIDVAPLASIRVRTGLRMPDACVVLAATMLGAPIASFDDRLVKAAQSFGIRTLPTE